MRPTRTRRLLTLAVTLVLAATTASSSEGLTTNTDRLLAPPSACATRTVAAPSAHQSMVDTMACLLSFARARAGRPALRESAVLDYAAALKVAADVRCGEFTHTPCAQHFEAAFAEAGYPVSAPLSIGENLAWGSWSDGAPRAVMRAWLASPEHRTNLLAPGWKTFGLAVRTGVSFLGNRHATIWANEFGTR